MHELTWTCNSEPVYKLVDELVVAMSLAFPGVCINSFHSGLLVFL